MQQLGIARSYGDLLALLRKRQRELGVTCETINDLSGMADRYVVKVLAQCRSLGPISMGPILQAMGLCLIVAQDDEQMRRIASRLTPRKMRPARRKLTQPTAPVSEP